MGKNPAFQFYPGDWTRDMDDQDLEIEGAWIRIICRLWWSENKGEATKSIKEWARILRKTEQKTIKIFQILIEKHIADGCLLDNQNITIISRRMKRMVEISKLRYEVGLKGGNPSLKKINENLDNQSSNQKPRSSSSSSTSKKEKESIPRKKYLDAVLLNDQEYKKLQEALGQKNLDSGIEQLDYSITVKGGKYKDHYKTLLNWHKRGFLNGGNGVQPTQPKKPQRLPTQDEELAEFNERWNKENQKAEVLA